VLVTQDLPVRATYRMRMNADFPLVDYDDATTRCAFPIRRAVVFPIRLAYSGNAALKPAQYWYP